MSTIDWSEAPDWAKGHGLVVQGAIKQVWYGEQAYMIVGDNRSYPYGGGDGETRHNHLPNAIQFKTPRPEPWAGEGPPPAGTVCELSERVLLADSDTSDWFEAGTKIEIGGHAIFNGGTGPVCSVCVVGENFTGTLSEVCLRPIRTPEQIATDKRLHEIRNALTTIKAGQQQFPNDLVRGNITLSVVEAMIDAGYRVQVMP